MPRLRALTLGLLAVASLSVVTPARAGNDTALNGSMTVFNTIKGPGPTPGSLLIEGLGGGQSNVLGAFTAELDFVLNFNSSQSPTTFYGLITFVTAGGDQLDGFFYGHYVSPSTFVATVDFYGGTGPYARASGEATLTGTDSLIYGPLVFSADFAGSLNLKKSSGRD